MNFPLRSAIFAVFIQVTFAQSPDLFPQGVNRIDFETDGLFSGDIDISNSKLSFEQVRGSWNFSGSVGQSHHRVDYTPTFVTSAVTRREEAQNFDLQIERVINPRLTLTGSVAYSQGFIDHRSIWISEYYDQLNRFDPAYREAFPESFSGSIGLQWNYDPGKSFLSVSFSQADTTIVPGWETEVNELTGDASLFSTNEILRTFSGTAIWNTVVNSRMRVQQTLRIGRTQSRRIRPQFQSELAYALTSDLTVRLQLGGAHENPTLISRYGGLGAVYDMNSQWQVNLNYRYYEDTGEVNTANFNTSAPAIATRELSAGVRWSNGITSVLGSVGLYGIDYESVAGTGNVFFSGLYQDRDFTAVRVAVTHRF
jgi:hypothetical protein|tara:strand:- start:1961 stop:3064 length:1104 start_codon:yes stop_codon:yes gene_type:complete